MSSTERRDGSVAIIGMALRYAGANTVEQYWRNICDNVDALHVATDEEILECGVDPSRIDDPEYVRPAAFIANTADFDATFFGFSAHDAAIVDPQHRVFLECAWEAFEDAGYNPLTSGDRVGVFAGCGANSYRKQNLDPNMGTGNMLATMVANDKDFLATRVAYKLNLTGPAVVVQSACSTSLVATQMAFESLRRGECSMALAGGVSISFPQNTGYIFEPGMILSPDGRCRAFDAKAAGTAIGRGAGAVLLKPLADAVRDRDHIYAVIRGAAINNDGAAKSGYTAPSVDGQAAVIRSAMKMAGFAPSTVRYVEAHGTGTEVGDSIEIAALAKAFRDETLPAGSCTVSSVKPNVGHTDTAAGVSGLIKAALALRHRVVPGTLYFETPNPELGLHHTPFKVTPQLEPYLGSESYRAGVSSFGIGGTNAHVSLEEWRSDEAFNGDVATLAAQASQRNGSNGHHAARNPAPLLFPLSANSEGALKQVRERLAEFLERHPDVPLEDIAFTLQSGRKRCTHRIFFLAKDRQSLRESLLSGTVPKNQAATIADGRTPDVYFLFPGQGAQYVNMTRGLYETDSGFRATIDHGCEVLQPQLGFDLRDVLYPPPGGEEAAAARLQQTELTQPAVFLIEYALAKRLIESGIVPTAMIGHSLGEYAAAVIAGVFDHDDMIRLIAERGRLVQTIPPGSMLAVSLSEEEVLARMPDGVCIAALNAPRQTIVSGPTDLIQAFYATLVKERIACQPLQTSHAFHSSMLDPLAGTSAAIVRKLPRSPFKVPFLSNVTGTWITAAESTDPDYWDRHLRHAVRFSDGLQVLTKKGSGVLIEVGPGETLLALARAATKGIKGLRHVATTRRPSVQVRDEEHWMLAMGQLWLAGVKVDWQSLSGKDQPRRVSLPTYPFERQRYWIDHSPKKKQGEEQQESGPLKKRSDIASWLYSRTWQSSIPAPAASPELASPQNVLILKDPALAFSNALVQQVAGTGASVTVAVRGQQFKRISANAFTVDMASGSDLTALLEELKASERWPTAIVYTGNAGMSPQGGVQELFDLCQAVIGRNEKQKLSLFVITDRAFDVLDQNSCIPGSTALASLVEAVGLEIPGVTARVIDCDFGVPTLVAKQVHQELLAPGDTPLVAYRGRTRWLPSWTPLPPSPPNTKTALQAGGTYIVVGGTGGIGLVLAQSLAKTAGAHLVLVSRSAFAPPSDWERMASDAATPEADRMKAQALLSIQLLGGSVEIYAADIADPKRMAEIVVATAQKNGRVAGIIHAAGITGPTMVGSTHRATIDAMFAAKGDGTRWIEDVLANKELAAGLDFVLLCSSLSAVLPSVGISVYGAANAYLDGFAAAHDNPQGTRVIAVNWDNWSEAGMAKDAVSTLQGHHLRGLADFGITNQEGEAVFERLLRIPASQVAVATRPLPAWIRQVRALYGEAPVAVETKTPEVSGEHHPRPDLTQEYAPPTNDTERAVVAIWQELLGVDRVGIYDDFFELGGHSLLGTQVIARVREQFQVEFPLRLIFEATTPERFAALLLTLPRVEKPGYRTADEEMKREEIEI